MDLKLVFLDSLGTPLSIIEIYNSDWKDIEIRRFGHFSITMMRILSRSISTAFT